jgi:hypothetical protein
LEPIVLRDEEPPEDAVVVVRGGEMRSDHLRRTATRAYQEVGLYLVSVFAAIEDDVETSAGGNPT